MSNRKEALGCIQDSLVNVEIVQGVLRDAEAEGRSLEGLDETIGLLKEGLDDLELAYETLLWMKEKLPPVDLHEDGLGVYAAESEGVVAYGDSYAAALRKLRRSNFREV